MAKKNILQEVKALGSNNGKSNSKSQAKSKTNTATQNNLWEAWRYRMFGEELMYWEQIWEGSLEECFEELKEPISCQLEDPLVQDGTIEKLIEKYDHESEVLIEMINRFTAPKLAKIKQECQQNGEYEGENWAIALAPSRFKKEEAKYPFAYSPSWQVWEVEEDGSEGDLFAEGGLKECLEEISFVMNGILDTQYHQELREQGKELEPKSFFEELGKRRSKVIKEITESCLKKGKYKSRYWDIFSEYSKEECREIKANGEPSFI